MKKENILLILALLAFGSIVVASASDIGGMSGPLTKVEGALSGPIAKGLAVISVVGGAIMGVMGMNADGGGHAFKLLGGIAVVLGIALFATPIVNAMGGSGGGAVIAPHTKNPHIATSVAKTFTITKEVRLAQ